MLFYVLDDVGFGQLKPFGGFSDVSSIERLAENEAWRWIEI